MPRSRPLYLTLVLVAVILGMASRHYRSELPPFIGTYAGDTLWGAMIFLLAAVLWSRASTRALALGAILFCWSIELTQLYQAPWINELRHTRLGGLVLGYGFLWSDLVCYLTGICMATCADIRSRHT